MKSEEYKKGVSDALALVVHMKEWVRGCQIEKENAGENHLPDFIRQSVLWDAEKEIRRLLKQD